MKDPGSLPIPSTHRFKNFGLLGPMRWMVLEMLSLALVFVIGKSLDDVSI